MQNINWEMMTQFVFPEQCGCVEEIVSVDIKPIWQQIETDESVRLVGIYHIAAVARFNPDETPEYCEGTLIDQLEFDGSDGYFEYALPLEVDLPREKVAEKHQPQVCVNDVSFFVYDGSSCTFKWEVDCKFKESVEGALFNYEPIGEPSPFYEQSNIEPSPLEKEYQLMEKEPASQEPAITEELRFGYDAIFPEQPKLPDLDTVEQLIEQPNIAKQETVEEDIYTIESPYSKGQTVSETQEYQTTKPIVESSSVKLAPEFEFSQGIVEQIEESPTVQKQVKEHKKEKVVESNPFFPTDTDDFYNELTESYTILNVSNKIRYE